MGACTRMTASGAVGAPCTLIEVPDTWIDESEAVVRSGPLTRSPRA